MSDASMDPRFKVGTVYRAGGRRAAVLTVRDIHTTTNLAGEIVKVRYSSTHELSRRLVTVDDEVDTTIARGLIDAPGEHQPLGFSDVREIADAPRFAVGTTFSSGGKHPNICKITDVHTTRNLAGDAIKVRYSATHSFIGQVVTETDVTEARVVAGLMMVPGEERRCENELDGMLL